MIAIGFLIVFLTFRANTFTAGTIEDAEGQHVVDSGPYAVVRHPMYGGVLIMIAGYTSGSGIVRGRLSRPPCSSLVIVWRLICARRRSWRPYLAGYHDYRGRVRWLAGYPLGGRGRCP